MSLGVNTWNFLSHTRAWYMLLRLIYTITEVFFSCGYCCDISLAKIWRGEVCSYPISELAQPSKIPFIFSVGGTSWTKLNYAIFLKKKGKETIFLLFIHISCNNWSENIDNPWKYIEYPFDLGFIITFNGTGLDWHLNNSWWTQKIPNFATKINNIWFFTYNILNQSKSNV